MKATRRKPARPTHRSLTKEQEQELAQVICAAVHSSGCACKLSGTGPCSKMIWAAGRVTKFLDVAAPTKREAGPT